MSNENNTSSRAELYLERAISGGGTEGLPTPISRLDKLLYALIANGGGGGGGGLTEEQVQAMIDAAFANLTNAAEVAM